MLIPFPVPELFVFRKQPWKALYLSHSLFATLFVRVPYWTVVSAIPACRPRRSWTFFRAFMFRLLRSIMDICFKVGFPPPEGNAAKDSRKPSQSGFVWVEPVPIDLVTGELAELAAMNGVRSERIWGYWYGERDATGKHGQSARTDERVLYYLHGSYSNTSYSLDSALMF